MREIFIDSVILRLPPVETFFIQNNASRAGWGITGSFIIWSCFTFAFLNHTMLSCTRKSPSSLLPRFLRLVLVFRMLLLNLHVGKRFKNHVLSPLQLCVLHFLLICSFMESLCRVTIRSPSLSLCLKTRIIILLERTITSEHSLMHEEQCRIDRNAQTSGNAQQQWHGISLLSLSLYLSISSIFHRSFSFCLSGFSLQSGLAFLRVVPSLDPFSVFSFPLFRGLSSLRLSSSFFLFWFFFVLFFLLLFYLSPSYFV